ncbi:MAG: bifunctional hydroxymethylpyrimidine kinase/phosphomethylpyrimidine kinase [Acidimicrobiales bacterium]
MTSSGDPRVALTIAGSDSGAGAGIQADLKSMAALGVYATTAITAVTAQNTVAVTDVHVLPIAVVESQITSVLADFGVTATKTGMLATAAMVEAVARRAEAGDLPRLVVDPVMVATTGAVLLDGDGIDAYRHALVPHALITTPNLFEAALLCGADPSAVETIDDMEDLARSIHSLGSTAVLVKGGHLPGAGLQGALGPPPRMADVFYDGSETTVLRTDHIPTANTHGTGCSLSAAIAAYLARGLELDEAVRKAQQFVHRALADAAGWRLGAGHGPLDHFGWATR